MPSSSDNDSRSLAARADSGLKALLASIASQSTSTPAASGRRMLSRRNAMKHGLCATDAVFLSALSRYERRVYTELRDTFRHDYDPQCDQELLLVDRIALEHFRLLRLYRIEHQAYRDGAKSEKVRDTIVPFIDRFARYETHTNRQIRILHNRLHELYYERGNHMLNRMNVKE